LHLLEITEQFPDLDREIIALEGGQKFVTHLLRERDGKIIQAKKQQVLRETGKLKCEVCTFDFKEKYGAIGSDFCEVHHIVPLSESDQLVETKLNDLAILCSNCHRMIHKTKPMESITEFKKRFLIDP
jgi:5-methylcytosine-specific restriction enzyme A